ncbi:hypothetical protein [Methylocystis parvus]|uniref:hypothetical protein n=1 Tax=Methylocystis parvus TaxID=134 RepID=UPI00036CB2A1|nr:hypothetical protein [Methylocystis parvus]WBJ99381.1 hypothetical protein MMG94_15485 [Methylocystis parvus OBBP]
MGDPRFEDIAIAATATVRGFTVLRPTNAISRHSASRSAIASLIDRRCLGAQGVEPEVPTVNIERGAFGGADQRFPNRRLPEVVLLLLFATFLMGDLVIGYSFGWAGYRAFFATYIMVGLIVRLIFDYRRPRHTAARIVLG